MANVHIRVVKSKGTVEFDTDTIPPEVYEAALLLGLEKLVNTTGFSKIKKGDYKTTEEYAKASQDQAEKNADAMRKGTIKLPGKSAKASKVSGVVKTEAMRLARNIVKDRIKAANKKISHYAASEITSAAKMFLEQSPEIYEQAEANIKQREAAPVTMDIMSIVKADPELVKKAEARKKKDGQLSAKQSGMTAKVKPKPGAHAAN